MLQLPFAPSRSISSVLPSAGLSASPGTPSRLLLRHGAGLQLREPLPMQATAPKNLAPQPGAAREGAGSPPERGCPLGWSGWGEAGGGPCLGVLWVLCVC